MRFARLLPLLALPLGITALVHCGSDPPRIEPTADAGPPDTGPPDAGPENPGDDPDPALVPANKVDLLFVVDNSASMGDKAALLASSVGVALRRFVQPRCVDPN